MFSLVLLVLGVGAILGEKDMVAARAAARTTARTAAHLAARHGAAFAVLAVSGPAHGDSPLMTSASSAAARNALEGLLREVMPLGLTADGMYTTGFVSVEAFKTVRILGADLLVLGGMEGAGRCRNELFDANAGAAAIIASAAACPVLLVPAEAAAANGPFERILVGVDLGEEAERCRALLAYAARLAAREGAEFSAVHVLSSDAEENPPERNVSGIAAARERLAAFSQGLHGADRFQLIASEGDVAAELLLHARERNADLLVLGIGTDGGGVALAQTLAGTRCPVLLVGPAVLAAARRPAAASKSAKRAE